MSSILRNLYVWSSYNLSYKFKQIDKYIVFNPLTLKKLLLEKGFKGKNLETLILNYIAKFPNFNSLDKRPLAYMLGQNISLDLDVNTINEKLNKYDFEECKDINLLIIVIGSTVGDIYIPNRELSFENDKLNKILLFFSQEILLWRILS